jgi:hypothetical protein
MTLQNFMLSGQELKYSHALFLRFTTGSEKPAVDRAEWC